MVDNQTFKLQFQEPIQDDFYSCPTDPLNELYDFEISFKRFFYENNHSILLQIADEKFNVDLYHDVLDAFEDRLCEDILALSAGNSINISFGDVLVYFYPDRSQDTVACRLGILGTGKCNLYTLCLSQVVREISNFINRVLNTAVRQNYITPKNIPNILEWKLNNISE